MKFVFMKRRYHKKGSKEHEGTVIGNSNENNKNNIRNIPLNTNLINKNNKTLFFIVFAIKKKFI